MLQDQDDTVVEVTREQLEEWTGIKLADYQWAMVVARSKGELTLEHQRKVVSHRRQVFEVLESIG